MRTIINKYRHNFIAARRCGFLGLGSLVILFLGMVGSASAQSISNGGFANTNPLDGPNKNSLFYAGVTDWTLSSSSNAGFFELFTPTSGGIGYYYNIVPELTTSIPGGGNMVTFDAEATDGVAFYQTITGLTPGQQYSVNFYQALNQQVNNGWASPVSANWQVAMTDPLNPTGPALSGQSFTSATMFADNSQSPILYTPWQLQTFTFTASQASEALSFMSVGTGAPPDLSLANVSLTTAVVPEPAGSLLLGAVGFITLFRRRHYRKA